MGFPRVQTLLVLFCVLAMALSRVAQAADSAATTSPQAPIVVELQQFVFGNDGRGLVPLGDSNVVQPGDVIEYRATYTNRSAAPLQVMATLPVPEAVEYQAFSATASGRQPHSVALGDAQYGPEPLLRPVVQASGAASMEPVPYAQYRFVRWDLGSLPPGAATEVRIRAKVLQTEDKPQ